MDDDDVPAGFGTALRQSYARLAAWMVGSTAHLSLVDRRTRRGLNNPIEFSTNRVSPRLRAHKLGRGHVDGKPQLAPILVTGRGGQLISLLGDGAIADEIGERLGWTRQSVYTRLHRFQRQRWQASRTSGKFFPQLPIV